MPPDPRQNSFLALDPNGFHRVVYREWRDPRELHVICVHGLTRNSRDFNALAMDLASRCRVVCVDLVGRGASDWLEHKEDYGFPLYLSDAATLIALMAHTTHTGPFAKFHSTPGNESPSSTYRLGRHFDGRTDRYDAGFEG